MLNQIVNSSLKTSSPSHPILFATVLLLLDTFPDRNRLSIVGLICCPGASWLHRHHHQGHQDPEDRSGAFVAAVALLSFFYNSGTYAKASYRYNKIASLIIALPSNVESQIYMYLDTRSLVDLYEQFYALFADFNMDKRTGTNTLAT